MMQPNCFSLYDSDRHEIKRVLLNNNISYIYLPLYLENTVLPLRNSNRSHLCMWKINMSFK